MLEDHFVRARLARIEAQVGILVRQEKKQCRGSAVDVGGLPNIAELADVVGRDEADRASDVSLAGQVLWPPFSAKLLASPKSVSLTRGR